MKVLHVIASVGPRGGGPIAGVFSSSQVWFRHGHQRDILSLDPADAAWVAAAPVPTTAVGPSARWYARARRWVPWLRYGYTPHLVTWLRTHASEYDAVIINGLWNYASFGRSFASGVHPALPCQSQPDTTPHGRPAAGQITEAWHGHRPVRGQRADAHGFSCPTRLPADRGDARTRTAIDRHRASSERLHSRSIHGHLNYTRFPTTSTNATLAVDPLRLCEVGERPFSAWAGSL